MSSDCDSEFRREFRCEWCVERREDCVCDSPIFSEYGKCGKCGLWKPIGDLFESEDAGAVNYEICDTCHAKEVRAE